MQSLLSPFLSSSKNACESKPGAAIVLSTCLMVMASNPLEHSATGAADATPVDPMASPSKMAEMATPVLRTAILPIGWLQIRNPLPARHGLSTPTRLSRCWRNGGAASQGFTAIPASASSGDSGPAKAPVARGAGRSTRRAPGSDRGGGQGDAAQTHPDAGGSAEDFQRCRRPLRKRRTRVLPWRSRKHRSSISKSCCLAFSPCVTTARS